VVVLFTGAYNIRPNLGIARRQEHHRKWLKAHRNRTAGLMWSHCRTTSGAFAPQYWHAKESRLKTSKRSFLESMARANNPRLTFCYCESVLRNDLRSASASSIFFRVSASPFSSASVVHGTRFIASTAASSSAERPPPSSFLPVATRNDTNPHLKGSDQSGETAEASRLAGRVRVSSRVIYPQEDQRKDLLVFPRWPHEEAALCRARHSRIRIESA
jgi:hypothetical protein